LKIEAKFGASAYLPGILSGRIQKKRGGGKDRGSNRQFLDKKASLSAGILKNARGSKKLLYGKKAAIWRIHKGTGSLKNRPGGERGT